MTFRRGLFSCCFALLGATFSGCILIGEYDDDYVVPVPQSIMYETCYSDFECLGGRYCEELAVPVNRYTESVNAICTTGCFDDLDCDFSEFNGLPGACVDHAFLGGPLASRICVERCEIDADCDLVNGFGCAVVAGDRLCVPVF